MDMIKNSNLPPDIAPTNNTHININSNIILKEKKENEIKFCDGYQYDAVCPHDNLHFSSVKDWKTHHIEKHMDTKWKCPLCETVSASWHNYSYHVQIQEHNGVCPPPWICKLKLPSTPNQNKKAHSTINTKKPTTKTKHQLCEKRFGSKYQLLRHMKSEHTNYKVIDSKPQRTRGLSPKIIDSETFTQKRTINQCVPALPILSAPPVKKQKICGFQYKTQGTQCGFLNTLLAAATFIEQQNESTSTSTSVNNYNINNINHRQSNNVGVPQQIQQIQTHGNNNIGNNNIGNNNIGNIRYVALPNKNRNAQIICTSGNPMNSLASLMNSKSNSGSQNLILNQINYNNNLVINNNLINFNNFNNNVVTAAASRNNNNFSVNNNRNQLVAPRSQLQNVQQQLVMTGAPQNVTALPQKRAPRIVFVLKNQNNIHRK